MLRRIALFLSLALTTNLSFAADTAHNKILKFKDSGIEPNVLKMTTDDSIVFFLNETSDSLATMAIDFTGRAAHCASSNLAANDDGYVRSRTPFGPKDFATTCFHAPGTYKYTVYGLKPNPQGLSGTIIVE